MFVHVLCGAARLVARIPLVAAGHFDPHGFSECSRALNEETAAQGKMEGF